VSFFYPQAAIRLRVVWEDFQPKSDTKNLPVYEMTVLAKSLTVNINDYTQADSFECEIDYKNFPFDPRTIRSLGVTIYMQDMRRLVGADGSKVQIAPERKNVIFMGFADEESISFNDTDRTIRFEGRDFTSLLLDAPYPFGNVDISRPLDLVIKELLTNLPASEKIEVVNKTGEELPTIAKYAPDFGKLAGQKNTKNQSYWAVIQDIVSKAGLIAYIELDRLIISTPRNIFGSKDNYQFIYGKNIQSLEFKRKLGRTKGVNIQVISASLEKNKDVLTAKIPEEASEEWCQAVGVLRESVKIEKIGIDGKPNPEAAPYITFRVAEVDSKEALIKIGEGVFEEVGRQQIEGTLETKEMMLLQNVSGSHVEFDCTKIRNGTPVKIEINQEDMQGFSRLDTQAAREDYLKKKGYKPEIAAAISKATGRFDTVFYTKSVSFSLSQDDGFSMKLDFINFIQLPKNLVGR